MHDTYATPIDIRATEHKMDDPAAAHLQVDVPDEPLDVEIAEPRGVLNLSHSSNEVPIFIFSTCFDNYSRIAVHLQALGPGRRLYPHLQCDKLVGVLLAAIGVYADDGLGVVVAQTCI